MPARRTLLVNWVFTPTVGHAIEGFKVAAAFKRADPALDVGVMINRDAGPELGALVPEIDRVFPVDLASSLEDLPRSWDFVYSDGKGRQASGFAPAVSEFHRRFDAWVDAGLAAGTWDEPPPGFPARRPGALRFRLPAPALTFAESFWANGGEPRISILPGGATYQKSPPPSFWIELLARFTADFPDASMALIGVTGKTQNMSPFFLDRICKKFGNVRNAFDLGLVNQLAILSRCRLHVSPHTGMSFAAQCVGVPWLILSGSIVHEYLLNGVPFRCIYPACEVYPCLYPLGDRMLPECRARLQDLAQPICMDYRTLEPRIPEIAAAAASLLRGERGYLDCAREHLAELRKRGLPGVPFFDGEAALSGDYVF